MYYADPKVLNLKELRLHDVKIKRLYLNTIITSTDVIYNQEAN
jgi:hypothetical protein